MFNRLSPTNILSQYIAGQLNCIFQDIDPDDISKNLWSGTLELSDFKFKNSFVNSYITVFQLQSSIIEKVTPSCLIQSMICDLVVFIRSLVSII